MKTIPLLLVSTALLALAGCNKSEADAERSEQGAGINLDLKDAEPDSCDDGAVDITADTETGKFEMKLPGGMEASVKVPGGMTDQADFDIDGVGLYPGAKVNSIKVRALDHKAPGTSSANVEIGFSAPGDGGAVADWYEQQFAEKKITVARTGDSFAGKTADGDDFTLAMQAADARTRGTLTIKGSGRG